MYLFSNLRCHQTFGFDQHQNNQVYYLRVAAPDTVTFSFDLECFVPHDNASCLDATSAECGDSYVNDLQTPVGYTIGHPCIWVGPYPALVLPSKRRPTLVELGSRCCDRFILKFF